jgi:hypothetical protein
MAARFGPETSETEWAENRFLRGRVSRSVIAAVNSAKSASVSSASARPVWISTRIATSEAIPVRARTEYPSVSALARKRFRSGPSGLAAPSRKITVSLRSSR